MIELNIHDDYARLVYQVDGTEVEGVYDDTEEARLAAFKKAVELNARALVYEHPCDDYDYLDLEAIFLEYVDKIWERFEDRMREFMGEVAEAFGDAPIMDKSDSNYRLGIAVDGTQIDFYIPDSKEYDGTFEGVNFAPEAVKDGRVIGGMVPYNYTGKCWVPVWDDDLLEKRFALFTDETIGELLYLVKNHEG